MLTENLESTNKPFYITKIVGIKLHESYNLQYGSEYISTMTSNPYSSNDNYFLKNSLVPPALISKVYEAKRSGHISYVLLSPGKTIPLLQWQAKISPRDSIAKAYKDLLMKEVT